MLVTRFDVIHSTMYYCNMESALTDVKNMQIILEDKSLYFYNVKPVEITNALGSVIGILDEYSITNTSGQNYKLYKTKEENWYDISEGISSENNAILRALKLAIDKKEKQSLE